MIIDSHCHLDDENFNNIDEILANAKEAGISDIVIPGADIKDLNKAFEISNKFDNVYFGVGIHPYYIDDFDIDILKEFIVKRKCVAVGECGFDFFREPKGDVLVSRQSEIFLSQIELAKEFDKPLIIHAREANELVCDFLKPHLKDLKCVVFHCFNGSDKILELKSFGNVYFGIGGVVTFNNAKKLKEILPFVGIDKILIETDAPYLTPVPHRGEINQPSYTTFIAQKISEILEISYDEVCDKTTHNSKFFFNI